MVCLTWPHLANWTEIYNAAGSLQTALGIISPAQRCLCRPSLNIWGAHVGMNGGTGFRHKAAKGKPAGGLFNSSVNIMRSPPLSTQQTVYIADTLKGGDGCFLERPGGFSQNTFGAANRLWTSSLADLEWCVQSNHEGNWARYKRVGLGTDATKRLDNGHKSAVDIAQRAKQLLLHSLR